MHKMMIDNSEMRKACTKLVSMALIDEPKDRRVKMYYELLNCVRDDGNFLENVIIADK